ncbi:MAG: glycolate oxidase subunit GlcE [Minwuiales bacterium]|nr:glycolate oxidase subunit GlcE [Minwuiales bacterium]
MSGLLKPADAEQAREAVAWAVAEETPVEIRGRGSKTGLGRPQQTDYQIDLSDLSGISLYESDELVMSAGPGTPVAEIEAALAAHNQELAFEPPDYGPLYGIAAGSGSMGGVIACNLAGPRRIKAGAARDHFLGVHGISGRGEAFKSGGRVVKNVTGYDLCKLMTGSYGTLAAMTDLTFKVLPAPEKTRTVLAFGLSDETAIALLCAAAGSPHEVSGLAHLPAPVAARSGVSYVAGAGASVTAIRVEGPGPSVEYRCEALKRMAADKGVVEELHSHNSVALWREVRDVTAFAADAVGAARPLWRLSVTPTNGAEAAGKVLDHAEGEAVFDWSGGLIWLSLAEADDAHAELVRGAAAAAGGHATLIRAADAVRASVPVFQPQPAALAGLSARVKDSFDPRRILNPGRMYAGV